MSDMDPGETVVILNPKSGQGNHTEAVRRRAELHGYTVRETNKPGDSLQYARSAAKSGIQRVVAAGGDGTMHGVVNGIHRANAFDTVTLGVIPVGTGNNFAKNIGITDIDSAFGVLKEGSHRRIDVGKANGEVFLNSCIAGLTAKSSSETSQKLKSRFGELAYVITTLRSISGFETLRLAVDIDSDEGEWSAWEGKAICVLVGNGRRFTTTGSGQANMEDGLFEVVVIEDGSTLDLMGEAILEQIFDRAAPHVLKTRTDQLTISIHEPESIRFSLDGEILDKRSLSCRVHPRQVRMIVGEAYSPIPETG